MQVLPAEKIHNARDLKALRPDRAGVRSPQRLTAQLSRPVRHLVPVGLRHPAQARSFPIAEDAQRADISQQIERGRTAHIAEGEIALCALRTRINQDAPQTVGPAMDVG